MAEETQLPFLPQTPNQPGSVSDTRDGITVESNTGTQADLKAGIDALDTAIDKHEETAEVPPPPRDPTGKFTSRSQRRHSAVARMEDATAKEAAAKRERDTVTAENARLKAELETARRGAPPQPPTLPPVPPPQARAPQPPADPEPDPKDLAKYPAGEYDPRYLRDVGRHEARQEFQRQRAEEQKQQAHEQHIRVVEGGMTTFSTRMREAFPDEDGLETFLKEMPPQLLDLKPSAVQQLQQPQAKLTAANAIADCITDAESPVALMRYFKDHPKIFQRLSTLHPIAVFREMGKIEASLAAASPARTAPRDPQPSRARPPVQRVESVPQMSDAPPGDDASDEEHAAYYNRKEKARRFGKG